MIDLHQDVVDFLRRLARESGDSARFASRVLKGEVSGSDQEIKEILKNLLIAEEDSISPAVVRMSRRLGFLKEKPRKYNDEDVEEPEEVSHLPGQVMENGSVYEPEKQPHLGDFIRNRFAADYGTMDRGDDLHNGVGFILADGTPVNMGGHDSRYEDHRAAIPTSNAMQRWGWPADVIKQNNEGTRWPALRELLFRSGALRVNIDGRNGFHINLESPNGFTRSQIRAILSHVQRKRPRTVTFDMGDIQHEMSNPEPHEVEEFLANPMRGRRRMSRKGKPRKYSDEAFHENILSNPHDSLARKVYADFLEERGNQGDHQLASDHRRLADIMDQTHPHWYSTNVNENRHHPMFTTAMQAMAFHLGDDASAVMNALRASPLRAHFGAISDQIGRLGLSIGERLGGFQRLAYANTPGYLPDIHEQERMLRSYEVASHFLSGYGGGSYQGVHPSVVMNASPLDLHFPGTDGWLLRPLPEHQGDQVVAHGGIDPNNDILIDTFEDTGYGYTRIPAHVTVTQAGFPVKIRDMRDIRALNMQTGEQRPVDLAPSSVRHRIVTSLQLPATPSLSRRRYQAAQAPKGGMVWRKKFYPGGKTIPTSDEQLPAWRPDDPETHLVAQLAARKIARGA